MTPQDRVTKSHIAIMRSKEFCMFAGVLSIGDVKFTDELPTAATNGRDVIYNPQFVDTLTDKKLNFVVLHEALHKVYQHMHLWKKLWKQDPQPYSGGICEQCITEYVREKQKKSGFDDCFKRALAICGRFECRYHDLCCNGLKEEGSNANKT